VSYSQVEPKYAVFVSGLEIGSEVPNELSINMLFDFLMGNLAIESFNISHVSTVVFVGNNLSSPLRVDEQQKAPSIYLFDV
jgi:hypothetical protein